MIPLPIFRFAILASVDSMSMLLTLSPPTCVFPAICPFVDSEAFFLLIRELAFVCHPIIGNVEPIALHVIVQPLAVVGSTIRIVLFAQAVHFAVLPFTNEDGPVLEGVLTFTVFYSL